ncbi:ABC transporter ATP-binding protein [Spongiactinospora sp. 9N601]|uniref:ABC transporter ATP-binding protein n=1 Tax=Spongiactinospora sp. 9N601 TaxID=3375149 RepID=UPI0037BC28C7
MSPPTSRLSPRRAPVLVLGHAAATARPGAAALLALMVLIASAIPAGLAIGSGALVGLIADPGRASDAVVVSAAPIVVIIGSLFLLQQVLPAPASAGAEDLGRRMGRIVADRMLTALGRPTAAEHLDHPRTARLVTDINSGLGGSGIRDALVGMVNIGILRGGAISGALIIITYRWWVALALFLAYGYAVLIMSRGFQRMLHSSEGVPDRVRRALYLKDLVPGAAKEVRIFGLADWLLGGYRGEWRQAIEGLRDERRGAWRVGLTGGAAVLAAQVLMFGMLAADLWNGEVSVGQATTLAIGATALHGLNTVTPDLVSIAMAGAVLNQVDRLERWTAGFAGGQGGRPVRFARTIVFEEVGFRYPDSDAWVLRGLNLTLPAGTSTAIVGINGTGKTTLVKLMCGLYTPTEGRILIDGVDLAEADLVLWQRQCAALFQDWVRWGLTIRENVLLGAPAQPDDQEELQRTADLCGLTEVVEALPDGWSTVLSREFGGVDLSGGQWQRVGLCRALWALRAGAGLLVLDEPTAALDVRGESELYNLLLQAAQGKSIVLISHRFSTVRYADQIVVLEDGRVLESGDHQSLLAAQGRYAEMFHVQADRFGEVEATS